MKRQLQLWNAIKIKNFFYSDEAPGFEIQVRRSPDEKFPSKLFGWLLPTQQPFAPLRFILVLMGNDEEKENWYKLKRILKFLNF
jgi:hypothetical protein